MLGSTASFVPNWNPLDITESSSEVRCERKWGNNTVKIKRGGGNLYEIARAGPFRFRVDVALAADIRDISRSSLKGI
jgi:hypothetical protein